MTSFGEATRFIRVSGFFLTNPKNYFHSFFLYFAICYLVISFCIVSVVFVWGKSFCPCRVSCLGFVLMLKVSLLTYAKELFPEIMLTALTWSIISFFIFRLVFTCIAGPSIWSKVDIIPFAASERYSGSRSTTLSFFDPTLGVAKNDIERSTDS